MQIEQVEDGPELFQLDVDADTLQAVTPMGVVHAGYSPDGTWLTFSGDDSDDDLADRELHLVRADTLTGGAVGPTGREAAPSRPVWADPAGPTCRRRHGSHRSGAG